MTWVLLILLGAGMGAADFIRRTRRGDGDPKRPLRLIVTEACLTGVISSLIGFAITIAIPKLSTIKLNPSFAHHWADVKPVGVTAVVGNAIQAYPHACDAPYDPAEITCEVSLEPRTGRGSVAVELDRSDIQIKDDQGGEYTPVWIVLANRRSGPSGVVRATLVQGVPTRLEFTFRGLNEEAWRLPYVVLPIRYGDGGTDRLTISFDEISG